MTTEIVIFGVGMMVAVIVLLWFLIWHFVTKYSKQFQPVSSLQMSKKQIRMRQLNTEVLLTEEEKQAMKKRMWRVGAIAGGIILLLISIAAWDYWRFVVSGESVQATITSVSKHRSSGRRHRTTYTYTLRADMDGVVVSDLYSAGSYGSYTVGETIDAYANTFGTHTDLAIANIVRAEPLTAGGMAAVAVVIVGVGLFGQEKCIRTGRARIANLPARFRTARLAGLPTASGSSTTSSVSATPALTTPDGLPMYNIGGTRELPKDDFPKDS
ncbi:MAG: hypothetical protein AAB473_01050 [Patescibacteria group bacterium]